MPVFKLRRITTRRTLALVLIAAVALTTYIVATNLPSPGITIRFEIYEDGRRITDIFTRSDVIAAVFIRAITPDGEVPVFIGQTRGVVHVPAAKLGPVAKNWTDLQKERGNDPERFFTALIVSVAVVNKTSGKLILYATYFVDYPPAKIARGDTEIFYTLHIAKKRAETRGYVVKVDREEKRGPPLGYSFAALGPPYTEPPKGAWCEYYPSDIPTAVCWYRKAWIGVDNLTAVFPSSYFAVYNGKTYMKVPVIMAVNNFTASGSIGIGISVLQTTAKISVIASLAVPTDTRPSISLAGRSWGGELYYISNSIFLDPTRSGWIWIYGRPVFASYDVWYYVGPITEYIGEENYFYIADIYVNNMIIISDQAFGLPSEIVNFFYEGVTKQGPLTIPGTALDDGKLDPGEYLYFSDLFPYYDKCGADFEIGIPVGAIIVAALTKNVQLTLATAAIKALEVSLSVEGANVYIIGHIYNYGDHPGVPNDMNIAEYIAIAVGKYKYTAKDSWGNTCTYDVPAGLYIESR
ncbi:MAG: hypothetical protein OWQ51_04770 [Pyrobaculum arsenaticum]|uniref:hypothetical protein n=1 Tax=Pyrobaculum arsenaticum TaxID=121277 RepID=UPI0022759320|nr:hypothetical protein [Pyrobaculum arsenaticum]